GNTLSGIANGAASLVSGTDYSVSGNTVTIKKAYLATQPVGTTSLTFTFSAGATQTLNISISNTIQTYPAPSGSNERLGAVVLLNGKPFTIGRLTESVRNGQTVTTVRVDGEAIHNLLAAQGMNPLVTIPIDGNSDVVIGELSEQLVRELQGYGAVLQIKSRVGSYTIPAEQIDLGTIETQLGGVKEPENVVLQVEIANSTSEMQRTAEQAAKSNQFQLVLPLVNFAVRGTVNDISVELSNFTSYVERSIILPEGFDLNHITTGVVIESDGSVRHVPTKVTLIDGRYHAVINSLSNSNYAIVWHPRSYSDTTGHWAEMSIQDLGSRMIIEGEGDDHFIPNTPITRAEFATSLVRALGLQLVHGASPFNDVDVKDWYNVTVDTAIRYHLADGFEDGTFRPGDAITREQAMTMLSNAMAYTGRKVKVVETSESLSVFRDSSAISPWAANGVIDCLNQGIVKGRSVQELAPQGYITRAEAATMIQRLLQQADLID
ncbi:S-layer family protein, partial [Paenibacillus taihuensis]